MAPVRESRVNRPWTLPWRVVPHRQPGGGGGVAFLAFEEFGLVGVGGVGGGDLEDVPAQVLEGFGVVVGGECEQVLLGLEGDVGVEVVGELGQGAEDGLGLLDVDPALGERGPGRVVALEAVGEPHGPVRGRSGGPGLVGVPVGGRGGAGVAGDVDPVGVGEESGLRARPAAPRRTWTSAIAGGGVGGVHRPHRDPPATAAELIAHAGDHPGDRVRLVRDRCHGPIPAPTTDPRAGPESASSVDKGFRRPSARGMRKCAFLALP